MDNGHETTSTGVLRDEHRLILEVAHRLGRMLDDESNGIPLNYDTVEQCITFFQLFADACHHGKEEDLLFPELIKAGLPQDSGPIAVMLYEHEQGRVFVRAMAASIDGARTGDDEANTALRDGAEGFIGLITAHIGKENDVLFNMADGMIVGPECKDLCAQYDATCSRRFEGRSKEELEDLAAGILGRG